MRQTAKAIAFLAALLPSLAAAQTQLPTLPANTVLGRLGVSAGKAQAIPFDRFLTALGLQTGPQSCSSSMWFSSLGVDGVLGCTQPAFSDLTGSIAPTQLPNPTSSTLGGVRSKAAVANQFLTQIGTDGVPASAQPAFSDISGVVGSSQGGAGTISGALKGNGAGVVSQAACADLSNGTTNCSAAVGQLPGTTTNDNAASGKVGEILSSSIALGSAVSLTTATPANLASLPLTAGDWDVFCQLHFTGGATTTVSYLWGSVGTTSATMTNSVLDAFTQISLAGVTTPYSAVNASIKVGPYRASVASTTTHYCVAQSAFATSTSAVFGILRARRIR
jgi:hypothetical protein